MFLVCPKCLTARPDIERAIGFQCDSCGHKWEAPHASLAKAYYAELAELNLEIVADDGERFGVSQFPLILGRDSEFRALQSNLSVSRQHCSIDYDQNTGSFLIHDLGAKAGTTVAGKPLTSNQPVPVRPGDEIRLAGVRLTLDAHLKADVSESETSATTPGERDIDLTGCSPLGYVGIGQDGAVAATVRPAALTSVIGAVMASGDGEGWRFLALRRTAVRVNGEIAVERELMPSDQLRIAGRYFTFNRALGRLEPEHPNRAPSIVVRGLGIYYGPKRVLANLNCSIPGGRLTAIVGQSGAGKTTLIKVLSGLRRSNAGEVSAVGTAIVVADFSAWARQHFALVPQHDVVHAELTVRQCLEFAADLRLGMRVSATGKRERVYKAIRDTGLGGCETQCIAALSGGQRKRVNVAVELIGAPEVLLLDEPTTGLDYATERAVIAGLRRLSRQGRTVVYVTHSLATIDAADHVIVIAPGADGATVVAEGAPALVKHHFRADDWGEVIERVAKVLGEENRAASRPTGRPRLACVLRARLPRLVPLTARYTQIWQSNPWTSLATLVGLPLLLGLLVRLAVSADGRIGTDRLIFGLIAMFWLGMNQSVREIVREKAIFLQEQANRVGCFSYLMSKMIFFTVVALPQAILLSAPLKWLAVSSQGMVFSQDELRCPWHLMILMFWVASILGCTLGLLFSSICLFIRQKGEIAAVLLVILATLPQFLFSAKVLPEGLTSEPQHYYTFTRWHTDAAVPEFLSFFTLSRYLFVPLDAVSRDSGVASKAFIFNGTILAMVGLVTLVVTWLVLELFVLWQRRRS